MQYDEELERQKQSFTSLNNIYGASENKNFSGLWIALIISIALIFIGGIGVLITSSVMSYFGATLGVGMGIALVSLSNLDVCIKRQKYINEVFSRVQNCQTKEELDIVMEHFYKKEQTDALNAQAAAMRQNAINNSNRNNYSSY